MTVLAARLRAWAIDGWSIAWFSGSLNPRTDSRSCVARISEEAGNPMQMRSWLRITARMQPPERTAVDGPDATNHGPSVESSGWGRDGLTSRQCLTERRAGVRIVVSLRSPPGRRSSRARLRTPSFRHHFREKPCIARGRIRGHRDGFGQSCQRQKNVRRSRSSDVSVARSPPANRHKLKRRATTLLKNQGRETRSKS
jgi:hypothetical protein